MEIKIQVFQSTAKGKDDPPWMTCVITENSFDDRYVGYGVTIDEALSQTGRKLQKWIDKEQEAGSI